MSIFKKRERTLREIDFEIKRLLGQKRLLVDIQFYLSSSQAIVLDGVLIMLEEKIQELEQEIKLPKSDPV